MITSQSFRSNHEILSERKIINIGKGIDVVDLDGDGRGDRYTNYGDDSGHWKNVDRALSVPLSTVSEFAARHGQEVVTGSDLKGRLELNLVAKKTHLFQRPEVEILPVSGIDPRIGANQIEQKRSPLEPQPVDWAIDTATHEFLTFKA